MTLRRVASSSLVMLAGSALVSGSWWGLLVVPESNALALALSALLVVVSVLVAGLTLGAVLLVSQGVPLVAAIRRSASGLRGFGLGLVVLGALWWATSGLDHVWSERRGEIDALVTLYAGTARTAWLHAGVDWLLWLVCWTAGPSVVVALTRASLERTGAIRGHGRVLSLVPLVSTLIALSLARLAWTGVFWRPRGLSTDSVELVFVSAKLGALALFGAVLATLVVHIHARAARG